MNLGSIEISHFSHLQFLNIFNNQFNGGMDWNYSTLPNLQVLDAYNNNFSQTLPAGVADLINLKHLDSGGIYFYSEILKSCGVWRPN
ncbi:hypothetical protein QQ045_014713 [Rhodiola kirilowii]